MDWMSIDSSRREPHLFAKPGLAVISAATEWAPSQRRFHRLNKVSRAIRTFGRTLDRNLYQIVFLCWVGVTVGVPAKAQIDMGRVLGRVTDKSGAVVPGAKVSLTNEGTNFTRTTNTAADGNYVFPDIKVGSYRVEVEATGFEKFVQAGVTVDVRQDVLINATLVPGKMTQTIEVTGAIQQLQTQSSSTGQTIGGTAVNDLPLNGRDWTTLALISTGVNISQPDNSLLRPLFSADGHDLWVNDYRVNGIDNNQGFSNPKPYMVLPPPDALSEFKVETQNYSADLGFGGGAVVDATVKSGTNAIHGDVWEYLRNSEMDSANFFENSPTPVKKGLYQQSQFGGTLGGPVYIPHLYDGRNKTFFFVDYQGTRANQATPEVDSVPTATMVSSGYTNLQDLINPLYQSGTSTDDLGRVFPLGAVFDPATTRAVTKGSVDPVTDLTATATGYVRDPFYQGSLVNMTAFNTAAAEANMNILPATRLDSNAIKLLQLYPTPTQSGIISNFTYDPSTTTSANQVDWRVDENISSVDQLFATGSWSHEFVFGPPEIPNFIGGSGDYYGEGNNTYGAQGYALSETHAFSSTMVNEIRLGYEQSPAQKEPSIANEFGIPAQFGIQGIIQTGGNGGLPEFAISGLTTLGVVGPIQQFNSSIWDLTENLTKVHGAHTFKVGFQGVHERDFLYAPNPGERGAFTFSGAYVSVPNFSGSSTGIAQLLLSPMNSTVGGYNDVGGADSVSASKIYETDADHYYFGIYAQDDWKITPKLTLNIGVRWDDDTPEIDRHQNESNFNPGPPNAGAEFVVSSTGCSQPFSSSFNTLTAKDGIAVVCAPASAFGSVQKLNFAPRIGLAYRLGDKFVVRAGWGLFYVQGEEGSIGQVNGFVSRNYPSSFSFSYPSPNPYTPVTYGNGSIATIENGLSAVSFVPSLVNASGLGLLGRQWNYGGPYYVDYNFMVQYQLSPNQTFSLGYVGNQAHKLLQNETLNDTNEILPPGATTQNYVPFPDFARGQNYETFNGYTNYNGMQMTFMRKFSAGLDFNANFTWSRCMSAYRNVLSDETLPAFRAPFLSGFGIAGDYGPCDADEPHVLHLSGHYALPFGNGMRFMGNAKGVVNQALGGWQTNWILTLQDGQPFNVGCASSTTANFGCAALLTGQNIYAGPHNVNDWLNAAAFASPPAATAIGQTNYAPLGGQVGQAFGPGEHRIDFSLFKEFPVTESKHVELRGEFFNLTNTPWFSTPSQLNYTNTATFGRITALRDLTADPRQVQLALKFFW